MKVGLIKKMGWKGFSGFFFPLDFENCSIVGNSRNIFYFFNGVLKSKKGDEKGNKINKLRISLSRLQKFQ